MDEQTTAKQKKHILVVDDSEEIRVLLEQLLEIADLLKDGKLMCLK